MKVDISFKSSVYNSGVIATARGKLKSAAFTVLLFAVLGGQVFYPASLAHAFVPIITTPTDAPVKVVTKIATLSNLAQSIVQTATGIALKLKEFVGDPLANMLAKAALRSITQSTVNWINSGFKGSPSFVTNPEGFLTDVADQVIGAAIEDAAPLLCAPFQLDLRLALGLNYSFGGAGREFRCRLTDVIGNLQGSYNQFVAGDFRAGGWNSFINIAGVPQNNPYGAYLATQDYLGVRVVSATGQASKRLELGRGFLDWRECEVPGDPISVVDRQGKPILRNGQPLTRQGPCKKKGPVKTPGSVIEGQLQNALNVDLSGLALADEINEIFAALINQLIKTVVSPKGLAGASNYRSSFDTGEAAISGFTNDNQLKLELAPLKDIKGGTAAFNPGDVPVAAGTTLADPSAASDELKRIDGQAVIDAGALGAAGAGGENVVENVAQGKKATQSSDCSSVSIRPITEPFAYVALDGNKFGGGIFFATFACTKPGLNEWWEVDLETSARGEVQEWQVDEINKIIIYRPAGEWDREPSSHDHTLRNGNFIVTILDAGRKIVKEFALAHGDPAFTVPGLTPVKGRYVRIAQRPSHKSESIPLLIAEVEIFGKQTHINPAAVFTPLETKLPPVRGGDAVAATVSVRAYKPAEDVWFRMSLLEKCSPTTPTNECADSGYKKSPTPVSNFFAHFLVTSAQDGTETKTPDFITMVDKREDPKDPESRLLRQDRVMNPALKANPPNTIIFTEGRSLSPNHDVLISLAGKLTGNNGSGIARGSLRFLIEAVKDGKVLSNSNIDFKIE